jgi:hypothetical protein
MQLVVVIRVLDYGGYSYSISLSKQYHVAFTCLKNSNMAAKSLASGTTPKVCTVTFESVNLYARCLYK